MSAVRGHRSGLAALVIWIAAGCSTARPERAALAPAEQIDPASEVFNHCRELACTMADIPPCQFSVTHRAAGSFAEAEQVRCARDGDYVSCEDRRAPLGGIEDSLKFRCSGDPFRCEITGGDPKWISALRAAPAPGDGSSLSCHGQVPGGAPMPPAPAIASPDTA